MWTSDRIEMELMDIFREGCKNPHVTNWYYKLDPVDEVTIQSEVERAEKVPAARNDILAKRFGLPWPL